MHDAGGIDAKEPDGRLLIGVQEARSVAEIIKIRIAGHQAAVIAPVEASASENATQAASQRFCRTLADRVVPLASKKPPFKNRAQ